MSLYRRAKKRDKAEPAIIQALEAHGAEVFVLDKPCDLLTLFRERWQPLEVKSPYTKAGKPRKRCDQPEQTETLQRTKIPVVCTPLEALEAIGAVKREGAVISRNEVTQCS